MKSHDARNSILFGTLILALVAPVGAHAQTTEECMAELRKVQAYIDNQDNQNSPEILHATDLLVQAENAASRDEGKECMDFVTEAKGASGFTE